jgi:hypothetical protein
MILRLSEKSNSEESNSEEIPEVVQDGSRFVVIGPDGQKLEVKEEGDFLLVPFKSGTIKIKKPKTQQEKLKEWDNRELPVPTINIVDL